MRTNRPTTAAEDSGLGPKKTALVLFTVVGCIAILFPKIFYPMLMGPSVKDRGPSDLQKQERPTHINELVYPSMQERGRAIPPHSIPIIERPGFPGGLPQKPGLIERRPGSPLVQGAPGPSMRAASFQAMQQQQTAPKGQASSIVMPIYTFGIVAFFVFTIVKIIMKKIDKKKVKPFESDPVFVDKVFKQSEPDPKKKLGWKDHNAIYTAIQGIIDATNDQLEEIEKDCALNNEEHIDNDSLKKSLSEEKLPNGEENASEEAAQITPDSEEDKENKVKPEPTKHDLEVEKRIGSLREALHIRAVENDENSDLKSIYLEGELPHDPKILVSATETETKTGRLSNYAKDVADDEAVILSGKMTISLISLTSNDEDGENGVVEDHTTTNNVA